MQKLLIMLAVATIPAAAGGCNCCGIGACPCNPCNWFNRGAYCGPTATYAAPMAAPVCPPVAAPYCPPMTQAVAPAIMPQAMPQQYVMPTQAPYAAPYGPMMAAPAQAAPYAYMEPGCGYVEPGCGYMGQVGYGPAMPMEMSGCSSCDTGGYDPGAGAMMTPVTPTEQFIDPQPAAE
jgi:hypothetical protein